MELPIPKELNFTEKWINSIDKEVLKGAKVRDEKLKSHQSDSIYQYDLVDIDFNKPSCSKSYGPSQIQRPLKSSKRGNSYRSLSPQRRKKRYKKLKKHKHTDGRNTCGMRIAELAVPSKRHCIDTWRNRWDTLPTLMVDRLRQIVMDQKPIVPIQDAIICFKQKNTTSRSRGNKTVNNKKNKEIKLLCGIFGFRISSELQAPRNVTLGSSLLTISHVVNDEISRLLVKRKTTNLQKKIQMEIANKITNWIADILEQSTYNLMLEDYIELEKEEGHIWDIIDELVDNAVLLCKHSSSSSSDVADEESSDSNQSLIDEDTNVLSGSDSSDDNSLIEFEHIILSIIEKIIRNDIKTLDIDNTSRKNVDDIGEYSPKTLPENVEKYFENFLSNHIDKVIFNDEEAFEDAIHFDDSYSDVNNDSIPNTTQNIEEENGEVIVETNDNSNINNDYNQNTDNFENTLTNQTLKQSTVNDNNRNSIDITEPSLSSENFNKDSFDEREIKDAIKLLPQDNDDTIADIMNNEIKNINNKIGETNLRIDETLPLTDITSDDSFKKVKHSNIYMDSGQGQLNIKSNIRDGGNKKSGSQGIHFAAPNNNLLSDADESWPENLRFPTVKSTVSISKSVLSLGKINEDEEKSKEYSFVNEDDVRKIKVEFHDETVKKSIDEKFTKNDTLPVTKDVIETNNVDSEKGVKKNIKIELLTINRSIENIIDENLTNIGSRSVIQDIPKTNNVEKAGEIIPEIIGQVLLKKSQSKRQLVGKNLIDKNISQRDGPPGLRDKANETTDISIKRRQVKLSVKQMPIISIEPEIHTQNKQCSGKEFKRNKRTQTKPDEKSEIRIWCHGLQNVVQNLDLWLNWIDNTCKHLLHLKQKEKILLCNRKIEKHHIRKWIILKTNIDSDARSWEKLSIGLQVGLRSYKRFYHQNETPPTRPYKNHQLQQKEQPHRMEKICTCIWDHHVPLNPKVVHLEPNSK